MPVLPARSPSRPPRRFRALRTIVFLGFLPVLQCGQAAKAPEPAPTAPAATPTAAPPFPASLPFDAGRLPTGLASLSAQACNACHFAVHDEWSGSAHATGWSSFRTLQAIKESRTPTACVACHLPLVAQHATLATGYAEGDPTRPEPQANPGWDPTLQQEGVTCAACHVRDGAVIGPRAAGQEAPHPVVVRPEMSSAEFCAPCHQLQAPGTDTMLYDTWGEWSRSPYKAAGVRCQDCHMTLASGPVTASRYAAHADHATRADPRRALSVLVSLPGPVVQRGQPFPFSVRVQNTGAGHAFPTGPASRSWRLEAGLVRAGKALAPPLTRDFVRTLSPTPPFQVLSDERLAAGAEVLLQHTAQPGQEVAAGDAVFQVAIRRSPTSEPLVLSSIPVIVR